MSVANEGSKVKVNYTGKYKDTGEVFDSSEGREPLEFVLGEGMVIAGFEKALVGMQAGETASIEIPPEEGYGSTRPELIFEVRREQLPPNIAPEEGMMLEVATESGQAAYVRVSEVAEETVTLDGNHPLADQTLQFEIELVEVS